MCTTLHTENMEKLFEALSLAQAEVQNASSSLNPHFKSKYAKLEDVVLAARPCLTKHGISVIQQPLTHEDGSDRLVTWLCHSSGQYLKSCMSINHNKQNIQDLARHMTYLKRICYAAMVGIVMGEEDDDAESTQSVQQYRSSNVSLISDKQKGWLSKLLKDKPKEEGVRLWNEIKEEFKVDSLDTIPSSKFGEIIERVK